MSSTTAYGDFDEIYADCITKLMTDVRHAYTNEEKGIIKNKYLLLIRQEQRLSKSNISEYYSAVTNLKNYIQIGGW